MRMNCPHCGLGGTVADEYYLEVVKCPECRKAFRVISNVLADPFDQAGDELGGPEVEERAILRLNCPHCGLGGTVADEYYLEVVNCPECKKIFRVTSAILVDRGSQSAEGAAKPVIEVQAIYADEKQPVIGDPVVEPETIYEDTGLQECAGCGFTFSSEFIRIIDGQQICPVCAN